MPSASASSRMPRKRLVSVSTNYGVSAALARHH
jgi:hypothetical protein